VQLVWLYCALYCSAAQLRTLEDALIESIISTFISYSALRLYVRLDHPHLMFTASSMVSGRRTSFDSGTSKYKALARSNRPDVIKHGCKTLPDSPEELMLNI